MDKTEKLKEKLEELKKQYSFTKDNKATNKYLGSLRAKIAEIKREITEASKKKKGFGFGIKKSGDATVVLVGFPNAGKSSLLNRLTNANSKIANYAFTTLEPIQGMLEYENSKIQVIDLPGLIERAYEGKGRGRQVASVIRIADLIAIVVDASNYEDVYKLLREIDLLNIKLNKEKPKIKIEKRENGGIVIESSYKVNKDIVKEILQEFKIYNAIVVINQEVNEEDIIDAIVRRNFYVRGIIILNKIDLIDQNRLNEIKKELYEKTKMKVIGVSAETGYGIDELKKILFEELDLIRIYLKPKDKEPDFDKPLILRKGSTILDVANAIDSRISKYLKYALVTGKSVKFANQKVGKDHILCDGDIVTLEYRSI